MREHADASPEVVGRLRSLCLALPEATEERAWVGTRWCVRTRNFAHVVPIDAGWPPAYAKAAGTDGPATVLMFRSPADELDAFVAIGQPFFKPPWITDIVGMVLVDDVDWEEVAELVTESYCLLAPTKLVELVDRPPTSEMTT